MFDILSQYYMMFVKPNILHKSHFLSLYRFIIWKLHALQKWISKTTPSVPSKDIMRALLDLKKVRNPIQTRPVFPQCP